MLAALGLDKRLIVWKVLQIEESKRRAAETAETIFSGSGRNCLLSDVVACHASKEWDASVLFVRMDLPMLRLEENFQPAGRDQTRAFV